MKLVRCDATLGAIISDIDLGDLDEAAFTAVLDAFHQHLVLVFPAQHLSDDEQLAFARRFGPLEAVAGIAGVAPIANVRANGELLNQDHPVMQILRGNEGWHTDSSYMPIAARASMLSAHVVPASGTQTEWADMRSAYQVLDDSTQRDLANRHAYHSIKYSQSRMGFTDTSTGAYGFDVKDAPLRPLVKIHPDTGRPALFIGRHAYGVTGLSPEESEALLDRLLIEACQPPRLLSHSWSVGDLVLWDNRSVLHRARPYDPTEPRVMHHSRVAGDPMTEAGLDPNTVL